MDSCINAMTALIYSVWEVAATLLAQVPPTSLSH